MTSKHFLGPIMVVEDNDDDYFILKRVLRDLDIECVIKRCASAEELIARVNGAGEYAARGALYPSLVFLDLNLPGVDGRELIRRFGDHPTLRHVPLVALTTSTWDRDIERCYDLGVTSYITKSHDIDVFSAKILDTFRYWLTVVQRPSLSPYDGLEPL